MPTSLSVICLVTSRSSSLVIGGGADVTRDRDKRPTDLSRIFIMTVVSETDLAKCDPSAVGASL